MATNPFEDEDGRYYALINDEGQYSLWPTFADVPDGWSVAHGEDSRQACLDYIEENWTDMRPNSLIRQMQEYEESKKLYPRSRLPWLPFRNGARVIWSVPGAVPERTPPGYALARC